MTSGELENKYCHRKKSRGKIRIREFKWSVVLYCRRVVLYSGAIILYRSVVLCRNYTAVELNLIDVSCLV